MIEAVKKLMIENWERFGGLYCRPKDIELLVNIKEHPQKGKYLFIFAFNSSGRPVFVIKVFSSLAEEAYLLNQYRSLNSLFDVLKDKAAASSLPKPVYMGRVLGKPIYIEAFCRGVPFRLNDRKNFYKAVDWITDFNRLSKSSAAFNKEEEKEKFITWYSNNELLLKDYFSRAEMEKFISANFNGAIERLCAVCAHGDFTHYNILIRNEGLVILDWEYSRVTDKPLKDLIIFLLYYNAASLKCSLFESLTLSFSKKGPRHNIIAGIIKKYNRILDIDERCFNFLLLNALKDYVQLKINRFAQDDSNENIMKFLAAIIKGRRQLFL